MFHSNIQCGDASKVCRSCSTAKGLDQFYKHPFSKDGRDSKCSECVKKQVKANRKKRAEYYKAYDRMRAKQPHRVVARAKWQKDNPRPRPEPNAKKRKARGMLDKAVRDGKIIKSPECQVCQTPSDTHGHHEDYDAPLDVLWVCTGCHALIHAYWRAQERLVA